ARGGAGQDGAPPGEGRADRARDGGLVRYLPLVLANLGRHKRRTFLTAASVALALFLFASLRTVVTTIAAGGQFGSAHRLVVPNATGIVFPLPVVYTPSDPVINDDMLIFRHDYFDERIQRAGIAGWYILQIANPDDAAGIAKLVDDQFRNSSAATKTGTEQAFNASFATMWGNVSLLMNTIGMAVVFAILLVTANAMMMSARERTGEVAVLKTIGFSDRRLFGLV